MSPGHLHIIATGDGSSSLFDSRLNETYHSIRGAAGESEYVFIRQGLERTVSSRVKIAEFGFGTGLNAIFTLIYAANTGVYVDYVTIDNLPIDEKTIRELDYEKLLPAEHAPAFYALHRAAWDKPVRVTDNFCLTKLRSGFHDVMLPGDLDLIYFDAFAPSKQPEVWDMEILKKCHESLKEGGALVTYCAQGQFKRNLLSLGFELENPPGPFGKKEMTRAVKASRG